MFQGRRILACGRSIEDAQALFRERLEMATKLCKWDIDKEVEDGK